MNIVPRSSWQFPSFSEDSSAIVNVGEIRIPYISRSISDLFRVGTDTMISSMGKRSVGNDGYGKFRRSRYTTGNHPLSGVSGAASAAQTAGVS